MHDDVRRWAIPNETGENEVLIHVYVYVVKWCCSLDWCQTQQVSISKLSRWKGWIVEKLHPATSLAAMPAPTLEAQGGASALSFFLMRSNRWREDGGDELVCGCDGLMQKIFWSWIWMEPQAPINFSGKPLSPFIKLTYFILKYLALFLEALCPHK